MKMGNNVPREVFKPISLAFQASVLPFHHVGSLMSPLYPCLPVYVAPCLRDQCRLLHSPPLGIVSYAYNYIHTGNDTTYIYTQGTFNNHAAHSLYRIMLKATSVMGVMKMGNSVLRAGIKPTSLAFGATVLPFHHVGSLMSPLYPCLPV